MPNPKPQSRERLFAWIRLLSLRSAGGKPCGYDFARHDPRLITIGDRHGCFDLLNLPSLLLNVGGDRFGSQDLLRRVLSASVSKTGRIAVVPPMSLSFDTDRAHQSDAA